MKLYIITATVVTCDCATEDHLTESITSNLSTAGGMEAVLSVELTPAKVVVASKED